MASVVAPLTVIEFASLDLPEDKRYELVNGEVVELEMALQPHEVVKSRILSCLFSYSLAHPDSAIVLAEAECQLSSNDVRKPDASLLMKGRYAKGDRYLPAPDLAVEVVSSEPASRLMTKVEDYIRAGTRTVWTVYPETRTVIVYEADGTGRRLHEQDTIDIRWLPGFSAKIATFFELL